MSTSSGFYFVQFIGAGGLGFDSRAGQIGTVSPTARHRCDVSSELCNPARSYGDGPRHSLHALSYYREYNEDFKFDLKLCYLKS